MAEDRVAGKVRAALDQVRGDQFIPGGVVGVVVPGPPDGEPVSAVIPFGDADLRSGRPVGASTGFEIGSLSKLFTATVGPCRPGAHPS